MYSLKKQFFQTEYEDNLSNTESRHQKFSSEQILYEGTPFFIINYVLKLSEPLDGKVIYDLGSGYGRFIIAGSLKYKDSYFKGIELVTTRAEASKYFIEKLQIKNALIIEDNVLNLDLSDGDIFFLFNPFSEETLGLMISRLRSISREKFITVLAIGKINEALLKQDWLTVKVRKGFKYKGVDMWITCSYRSI